MLQKRLTLSINFINLVACILLTATSLYYTKAQQIGFYAFFISYLLEIFIDKKWKNIRFDKARIYYLGLLLFFLLIFIYHPFENSDKYFNRLVELRLALFGFSIVGFFGLNKLYKVSYLANAFVVSAIISIAYIILGIGVKEFISNPERGWLATLFRVDHINSHIVFNAYLNIAIVCCWYLIFYTKSKFNTTRMLFYIVSTLFFIYFLAISEGRIGIAVCAVLLFCISTYQLWKIHKLLVVLFFLIAPVIVWVGISQHKRMSKEEVFNDPRSFIWKAAAEVVKKQPVIGYGASRAQEEFDTTLDKYQTKEFKESWKGLRIMHSHNQFIQTYMEFGIFGIVLLLGLISGPIILTESKRRLFAFLLLFVFVSQFMTDIVITYQGFPVIFGILTLMTIAIKEQKTHQEKVPVA